MKLITIAQKLNKVHADLSKTKHWYHKFTLQEGANQQVQMDPCQLDSLIRPRKNQSDPKVVLLLQQ